ncbi:MAG: hydroxymethylbilane synthase [Candidatus Rokubacteria bacterium]|nr:hydroxymethylbilane synthase [Candidatus Rokubacteria bacterium]
MKLGTRGSPLALAQANAIATRLGALGAEVEIVPIRTEGDRLLEARLAAVGGKGLFVKEIEEALLQGAVDCAVHSLKDLPADVPAGLALVAFPEREDPRDVLVTRTGARFEDLPPGAVIGTSSPRRRAIVLALRPDLVVEPIRGNVDTRLRKLESGGWDGVILAAAGLHRLGLTPAHARPLAPDVFVPAVGQGILALEVRGSDGRTRSLVQRLDHAATRACALAERAYLGRLGASCNTPMAAHAAWSAGRLTMTAFVASEDGRKMLRGADSGIPAEAELIGLRLAESLLERGAAAVAALRV